MDTNSKLKQTVEKTLFSSKYLLILFQAVLYVGLIIYGYLDVRELIDMVRNIPTLTEEEGMLALLRLVDMAMIAYMVKLIITGGYTSFVSKTHGDNGEKTSSGVLKVKMSTGLIGVSSIHLLRSFVEAKDITQEVLNKQVIIHCMFLIGALLLALIDYLHVKAEILHESIHPNKDKNTTHD